MLFFNYVLGLTFFVSLSATVLSNQFTALCQHSYWAMNFKALTQGLHQQREESGDYTYCPSADQKGSYRWSEDSFEGQDQARVYSPLTIEQLKPLGHQ